MPSQRLAHAPLDPIPFVRLAQHLARGQPHPRNLGRPALAPILRRKKPTHRRRLPLPLCRVCPLIVSMLAQAPACQRMRLLFFYLRGCFRPLPGWSRAGREGVHLRCRWRRCRRPLAPASTLRRLVAESRAHRDALPANGAAPAQHSCACLGLHAGTKTVRLHPFPAIWLKCALWHRNALLFLY